MRVYGIPITVSRDCSTEYDSNLSPDFFPVKTTLKELWKISFFSAKVVTVT